MAEDLVAQVQRLRAQGLTDAVILDELTRRGYGSEEVNAAIMQADAAAQPEEAAPAGSEYPGGESSGYQYPSYPAGYPPASGMAPAAPEMGTFERMEEIAESLIDEKWEALLKEVKKILDWKEKVEAQQKELVSSVKKLKEDFTVLHQGVLGRLEEYDTRMQDVGTELKAVGKVFKDVVPEFVENVKELSGLTQRMRK
ncbi:hypothetical protein HYS49_01015 [Candidatus Woesearchaeota archaeon]|nr:hypothetical protein [Candidatus Woesearchaeota archaeon]